MSDVWSYAGQVIPGDVITADPTVVRTAKIKLSASSNITAGGGDVTTAQLTAPAGKTSGTNFQAGNISDDTNPLTLDLAADKYTEFEFSVIAPSTDILNIFEFRIIADGQTLNTYTVTPQITINASTTLTPVGIQSAEAFGIANVANGGAPSPQSVTPVGIGSTEAFGKASVDLTLKPTGIGTGEALGEPVLNLSVKPTGIGSTEAFGKPALTVFIKPTGVTTAEAFGKPAVDLTLEPTGIKTAEAFGTPALSMRLVPTGIASGEAFGKPTVTVPSAQTLTPTGITSAEAFGKPAVDITLEPTGIKSAEAFGAPVFNLHLAPTGISTTEAFGKPTVTEAAVQTLLPTGIKSAEAFGTPALDLHIAPTGISSAEAFGKPATKLTLEPTGIASTEAFGAPQVSEKQTLVLTGITSAEAFGTPFVGSIGPVQTVTPVGIGSGELFGTPAIAYSKAHGGGHTNSIGGRREVTRLVRIGNAAVRLPVSQIARLFRRKAPEVPQVQTIYALGGIGSTDQYGLHQIVANPYPEIDMATSQLMLVDLFSEVLSKSVPAEVHHFDVDSDMMARADYNSDSLGDSSYGSDIGIEIDTSSDLIANGETVSEMVISDSSGMTLDSETREIGRIGTWLKNTR